MTISQQGMNKSYAMGLNYDEFESLLQLYITRLFDDGKQTTGNMMVYDKSGIYGYFATLEPSWLNNERNISCIPPGTYIGEKRHSEKYGWHILITGVPGRVLILLHFGNYRKNTKGCGLVGEMITKIDSDSLFDISNSRNSMKKLMDIVGENEKVLITIKDAQIYKRK